MPKAKLDVYPNYLSGSMTLSAANTLTTAKKTLPVPKIFTGKNPQVIEFLWLDIMPDITDMNANGDELIFAMGVGVEPTTSEGFEIDNGYVLAMWDSLYRFTTSGGSFENYPVRINFQTADGHGMLVATDNVWIGGTSVGQGAAVQFNFRITYRFVEVNPTEYLGIVTSQMAV